MGVQDRRPRTDENLGLLTPAENFSTVKDSIVNDGTVKARTVKTSTVKASTVKDGNMKDSTVVRMSTNQHVLR